MNDAMTLAQRADALEDQMSRNLDLIVIKSRLYSMADGDLGPPPNTNAPASASIIPAMANPAAPSSTVPSGAGWKRASRCSNSFVEARRW